MKLNKLATVLLSFALAAGVASAQGEGEGGTQTPPKAKEGGAETPPKKVANTPPFC